MAQYAKAVNQAMVDLLNCTYNIQHKGNVYFCRVKLDFIDIRFMTHLKRSPMTIKKMTETLGFERNEVAKRMNRLISAGLAKKQVLPEDKRSTLIGLTDQGEKCQEKSMDKIQQLMYHALDGFSLKEEKIILTYLTQLEQSIGRLIE